MIINFLITLVNIAAAVLVLLVVLNSILSFFMDYYHPFRQAVERIVGPLLNPIRRVVPLIGMFDFSPLILIILISILQSAVLNLLYALR